MTVWWERHDGSLASRLRTLEGRHWPVKRGLGLLYQRGPFWRPLHHCLSYAAQLILQLRLQRELWSVY